MGFSRGDVISELAQNDILHEETSSGNRCLEIVSATQHSWFVVDRRCELSLVSLLCGKGRLEIVVAAQYFFILWPTAGLGFVRLLF